MGIAKWRRLIGTSANYPLKRGFSPSLCSESMSRHRPLMISRAGRDDRSAFRTHAFYALSSQCTEASQCPLLSTLVPGQSRNARDLTARADRRE